MEGTKSKPKKKTLAYAFKTYNPYNICKYQWSVTWIAC